MCCHERLKNSRIFASRSSRSSKIIMLFTIVLLTLLRVRILHELEIKYAIGRTMERYIFKKKKNGLFEERYRKKKKKITFRCRTR